MTAVSTRKVCTGCTSSHDVSAADAGATEVCAPATKTGVLTTTIAEMCSADAKGRMPATAAKAGGPTAGVSTDVCATTATVSSSAAVTSKRADWHQQSGNKGRPKSYMTKHRFLLFGR
jgi:hypothetical protein